MAFTVRTHPLASHSARLVQSTYRSIASGLVRPVVDNLHTQIAEDGSDELSAVLKNMRALAMRGDNGDNDIRRISMINTTRAMLRAMRTRVRDQQSRLEAGLDMALDMAYPPATDVDWDGTSEHMDEFRFDLG